MCFSFLNMFNSTRPGKRLHNTNWKDPPFYSWENPRTFDWVIFNSYLNITRPGTSRMKPSRFRITGNSIRTYRTMGFTHGQTLRLCRKSCSHIPRPVDSYGTPGTSILYFFFLVGTQLRIHPLGSSTTRYVFLVDQAPKLRQNHVTWNLSAIASWIFFRSVNARSYRKCQSHTALGPERESCCWSGCDMIYSYVFLHIWHHIFLRWMNQRTNGTYTHTPWFIKSIIRLIRAGQSSVCHSKSNFITIARGSRHIWWYM